MSNRISKSELEEIMIERTKKMFNSIEEGEASGEYNSSTEKLSLAISALISANDEMLTSLLERLNLIED